MKTKGTKPSRFQKTRRFNQVKNILFDLDGTISDSRRGIFNGIIYATEKIGIYDFDKNDLESFIGPPLPDSFERKFNLTKQAAADAVDIFREYYAERGWSENELYPTVKSTIEELKRQGYRLFVATSKPTVFAKQIIEHFGLNQHFDEVVGCNLDNSRSEKSEIIQYIFDNHSINAEETVIIGDTKFDVLGAKHHSIFSVSVTYGFGLLSDLKSVEPHFIINQCDELLDIITYSVPFKKNKDGCKTIVFAHPDEIENESFYINQLFENGLDELVIRKPKWNNDEVITLLNQIDEQYHLQIYICDRLDVVLNSNVRGIHCSNAFYDSLTREEQHQMHRSLKEKGQEISISAHNPNEWAKRKGKFDQLYLCPIFESISKPGYVGNWDHDWIKEELQAQKNKESVIALGGISTENIDQVENMGFNGLAVLGFIWNDLDNCIANLEGLKKSFAE
ncbi:MAG: HAD hydrolase-like protein [Chitinophagales bacterium]